MSTTRDSQIAENEKNKYDATFYYESTITRIDATDLISEGPIEGLVDGRSSVYLDGDSIVSREVNSVTSEANSDVGQVTINGSTATFPSGTFSSNPRRVELMTNGGAMYTMNKPLRIIGIATLTVSVQPALVAPSVEGDLPGISITSSGNEFTSNLDRLDVTPSDGERNFYATLENPATGIEIWGSVTVTNTGSAVFEPNIYFNNAEHVAAFTESSAFSATLRADRSVIIANTANIDSDYITIQNTNNSIIPNGTYDWEIADFKTDSITVDPSGIDGDLGDNNGTTLTPSEFSNAYLTSSDVISIFRHGYQYQAPIFSGAGSSINVGAGSSFSNGLLEFVDSSSKTPNTPATAAPIFRGTSAAGFGLTGEQVSQVSNVSLEFSYDQLRNVNIDNGESYQAEAKHDIKLTIYRGTASDTFKIFSVDHGKQGINTVVRSKGVSRPIRFEQEINLEPYKPFTDFAITVERKSRHDGLATSGTSGHEVFAKAAITSIQSTSESHLSYPLTAYAHTSFTSKEYPRLPVRTYHCRGRLVKIPNNYTPRHLTANDTAVYSGLWNGSFAVKPVYTDNPAWVFYDILTNDRYGLGGFIQEVDIDKFQLYRVAKYCDELVPDGKGGTEPRFRANIYLTKAVESYKVLKDMATIFRGMLYWLDGKVQTIVDEAKDPVYTFSNSNVSKGLFSYQTSGEKTRANQIVVSWNNPESNYDLEPLLLEDSENIAKTGKLIKQEAMAFGCTSEGQALRYAKWKLWTSVNQTEVVSFSTSLDSGFLVPGDIVSIQDSGRQGLGLGGRISSDPAKGRAVTGSISRVDNGATISPGTFVPASGDNRAKTAIISGTANLPATFTRDECLFEIGGTGVGTYLGVINSGGAYNLVFRAGDGASTITGNTTGGVFRLIPISEIPEFNGQSHKITIEYVLPDGIARLYIGNRKVLDLQTSDKSNFDSGLWAGNNDGGWGKGAAATAGEHSTNFWTGQTTSDLSFYSDPDFDILPLDRSVVLKETNTYSVTVLMPQAQNAGIEGEERPIKTETRNIDMSALTFSGGVSEVDVLPLTAEFSQRPAEQSVFVINEVDANGQLVAGTAKQYKLLSIEEGSQGVHTLTGVEHYNEKFAAIENEEVYTVVRSEEAYPDLASRSGTSVEEPTNLSLVPGDLGGTYSLHWEPPVNSDGSLFKDVDSYKITCNKAVFPFGEDDAVGTFVREKVVSSGTQEYVFARPFLEGDIVFSITTITSTGKTSYPANVSLTVPPHNSNSLLGRGYASKYGLAVGGKANTTVDIATSNGTTQTELNFQADQIVVQPAQSSKAESIPRPTGVDISLSGLAISTTPYDVMYDADADQLVPIVRDTYEQQISGMPLDTWRDATLTNAFTANLTGTISKASNSHVITGSGTSFTTELQLGDTLKASNNMYYRVATIKNDTHLTVDRNPKAGWTNKTFAREKLRLNFAQDFIVGQLLKTGTNQAVFTTNMLLVNGELLLAGNFNLGGGSVIGGVPVSDVVTRRNPEGQATISPRVNMTNNTAVQYAVGESGTHIFKNEEPILVDVAAGTKGTLTLAAGDVMKSNKAVSFVRKGRALNAFSSTGTKFCNFSVGTNNHYDFYAPYGSGNIRYFNSTSPSPTKLNGSPLIEWNGNFEKNKTLSSGSLIAGVKYKILTTGNTDFTTIGAADSNPNTEFTATGAGPLVSTEGEVNGTVQSLEGFEVAEIGESTVLRKSFTGLSGTSKVYVWILSDTPLLVACQSGVNDNVQVRPASTRVLTYDNAIAPVYFDPTKTEVLDIRTSNDWSIASSNTRLIGSFDNGDGTGGDGVSALPWNMCGDVYMLPHRISNYQVASVEPTIITVSYWDGTDSKWIKHATHDLMSASALNLVGLKIGSNDFEYDSANALGGGSNLWKFTGTGTFALRTNDEFSKEYFADGYSEKLRKDDIVQVGKIIAEQISTNAITAAAVADNAITVNAILDGAVANAKIAVDAIQGNVIAAGAIVEAKLGADAVTAAKIADNAVTTDQIANDAVTTATMADNAVTNAIIATDAVNADSLVANAVTAVAIQAGSIEASKIAADAVTADSIAANAITSAKITANAITASKIATNTITANEIAANAVTASEIAANAVTANEIAANAVTASEIQAGAITADAIAVNSIAVNKLTGDVNEEYSTQFRAVQTGDHTLASTLGTYSTIQAFSIPAPEGVAKAVKISGTLSTRAFNGTGSTQSTEYSIHLEMKAKGTAATNLGTAAADAVGAGLSAETVYISGNKLKEFGSAGSVSAAANGSSGQGDVIGVYYDAPTNRTYIQYLDASLSFDSGDTIYYSAENFTSANGFVQIQSGFDDATDKHSIIALPNNETFYDKTYLSASLPKTSTATEFRLRVRNRKVLPSNLNVTFPTGAFKLEHIV